jgi:phage tail sheath protein FI
MPYTYPGVYIQELQSPVHTITGVPTSIPAFVGYTPRGIDNRAQVIFSFADFERLYGGLASDSELSYAIAQFYQNAPGAQAYVVRVPRHNPEAASVTFSDLTFQALSSGAWANGNLIIDVDQGPPVNASGGQVFNLTVTNLLDGTVESFPDVTLDHTVMNYVAAVVNDPDNGSQLITVIGTAGSSIAVNGFVTSPVVFTSLTSQVGGSAAATTASGNYGFELNTDTSMPGPVAGLPVQVTAFSLGSTIPQTPTGLATQLQQAINAALSPAIRGASAQVSVVSAATGSDNPLRIVVTLPGQPDAVMAFSAPSAESLLSDVTANLGLTTPTTANVAHYALGTTHDWVSQTASAQGSDLGGLPWTKDLVGDQLSFTGIYALEKVDLFNLLSIPDATRALPGEPTTPDNTVIPQDIYSQAIAYCDQRRAFLLVDPPSNITTVSGAVDWISNTLSITDPNGAAFWPRLRLPDPLNNYNLRSFAPSGVAAGVYAATDGSRGVWKAPAGINATLNGVQSLTYTMTDQENGLLNPLGLNCFRAFPVYGRVLWGARTLRGADAFADQWKYVPVRRMALFLEESLYRGLKWVVFEPNDAPLWSAIRLNVEAFMQTLFLKRAFQGSTPDQAYFVKCDSETTTQIDIDSGIVNILVGFAPLKPTEFVVIQIEQLTGQG